MKRPLIAGSLLLFGALIGIAVGHRTALSLRTALTYPIKIKNCTVTTGDPNPRNTIDSVEWKVESGDSAIYIISFAQAGTPINPLEDNAIPIVSVASPDPPHTVTVPASNCATGTCGYYRYKLVQIAFGQRPSQAPTVTLCSDPGIHVTPPGGLYYFFFRVWTWFAGA